METAIVCAHTKAASTCYRLDPPGSNFLGSLFCTALTGYVIMLSAIYRVFLFLSCLLSFVDTHRRLDSPCVMRVYVFNSLSIVKVGYRLTHAQGDPALIRGGGARNRGTFGDRQPLGHVWYSSHGGPCREPFNFNNVSSSYQIPSWINGIHSWV